MKADMNSVLSSGVLLPFREVFGGCENNLKTIFLCKLYVRNSLRSLRLGDLG